MSAPIKTCLAWGWGNGVNVRAELRSTLVPSLAASKQPLNLMIRGWYVHMPRYMHIPRYVHVPLKAACTSQKTEYVHIPLTLNQCPL